MTNELEEKIINKIISPTLNYLKKHKGKYIGFLYAGLMIKNNEPYLIEFNVRMGDPECQVILPRLKTDLTHIIINAINENLKNINIRWCKEKSMTIVICSKGYPGKYQKNKIIKNLDKLKFHKNIFIFHAGTKYFKGKIVSNGGRVLNISCIGNNFKKIRKSIIKIIQKINWKEGFFRKDIGWKVIK